MEIIWGILFIMALKITDVSLGTIRTIMVVQGKKKLAGILGFIEVTIWVLAIREVMLQLDNLYNVFAYSTGFAIGTILGIWLEQKFGIGFLQVQVFSKLYSDKIAMSLREQGFGVTMIPGEVGSGGVPVVLTFIPRKRLKEVTQTIDSIDVKAFYTIQPSMPFKGYIQMRK